jgi:hypothetical protein
MELVQILLPRFDTTGRRVDRATFLALATDLRHTFGGVTAYLHSPAVGVWKQKRSLRRDEVIVFEVMVHRANRATASGASRSHWPAADFACARNGSQRFG